MEALLQVSSNIHVSFFQSCFSLVLVESRFSRKELQIFLTEGSKLCLCNQGCCLTLEMGPSTAISCSYIHASVLSVFVLLFDSLVTVNVVLALETSSNV